MARLFMSGHCDAGRHTPICTGQYTLTPCTCPCHESDAPADGDV